MKLRAHDNVVDLAEERRVREQRRATTGGFYFLSCPIC
jgi:hypothetical protein